MLPNPPSFLLLFKFRIKIQELNRIPVLQHIEWMHKRGWQWRIRRRIKLWGLLTTYVSVACVHSHVVSQNAAQSLLAIFHLICKLGGVCVFPLLLLLFCSCKLERILQWCWSSTRYKEAQHSHVLLQTGRSPSLPVCFSPSLVAALKKVILQQSGRTPSLPEC